MNNKSKPISKNLIDFVDSSPSVFHVIANVESKLKSAGYRKLLETERWQVKSGEKCYVTRNGSALIAFRAPNEGKLIPFNIAAAHGDVPTFKIKSDPEMDGKYLRLNTERYGGVINPSWLDRPLSIAGRVLVQDGNKVTVKLVNIDRDLLLIPNVAIHLQNNVNDGKKYNLTSDTIPLFAGSDSKGSFMPLIARESGVEESTILGYDLFLYNRMKGSIWGANEEFVSCRGLDDLQCSFSALEGFLAAESEEKPASIPTLAIFDNEEVGNGTRAGGASSFLMDIMRRIYRDRDEEDMRRVLASSFLLSCDNAHATHPNHPEFSDATNKVYLNGGVVIKYNAAQRYITDGISEAYIKHLCNSNNIPFQKYSNRSDLPGGSTLGNVVATNLSLKAADIGIPQLAMHSSYETTGVHDTGFAIDLLTEFFKSGYHATDGDDSVIV